MGGGERIPSPILGDQGRLLGKMMAKLSLRRKPGKECKCKKESKVSQTEGTARLPRI